MYDLASAHELTHRAVVLARSLRIVRSASGQPTASGILIDMSFCRPVDEDEFESVMETFARKCQRHNVAGDIEVLEATPMRSLVRLGRPVLKQQRAGGFGHSAPAPGRHNNGDW